MNLIGRVLKISLAIKILLVKNLCDPVASLQYNYLRKLNSDRLISAELLMLNLQTGKSNELSTFNRAPIASLLGTCSKSVSRGEA